MRYFPRANLGPPREILLLPGNPRCFGRETSVLLRAVRGQNNAVQTSTRPRRSASGTTGPFSVAASRIRRGRRFASRWPGTGTGHGALCRLFLLTMLGIRAVWPGGIAAEEAGNENQLMERLIQQGVRFPGDLTVQLPEPDLVDGLDESQQRRIVRQLAQRHDWKQFVRDSTVAPFMLKQAYLKNRQGRRVGHVVDVWFVAHGPLRIFQETEHAKAVFGTDWTGGNAADVTVQELDDQDVLERGIEKIDEDVEKYALVAFSLMNKVYVQGVGHVCRSRTHESVIIAWELDSRFNEGDRGLAAGVNGGFSGESNRGEERLRGATFQSEDPKSKRCNRWQPIETTKLGQRERGAPRAYRGYGGYLKITDLSVPEGALLVEAHVVFHEPEEWFRGSNFLRAKIPLMVRENINGLRRKLASGRH